MLPLQTSKTHFCCIAVIHIQLYTYTCGSKINNKDERTQFFRKIYLSLYSKGLCVRDELETEQTATYWPQILLSLAALLSRSAGLLNRGSRGPIALCWVLVLTTASYLQLTEPVCGTGLYNCLTLTSVPNSTRPVKVISLYLRPDAPVIYTGASYLTARSGSICYTSNECPAYDT